jgi:hypothetical protein
MASPGSHRFAVVLKEGNGFKLRKYRRHNSSSWEYAIWRIAGNIGLAKIVTSLS